MPQSESVTKFKDLGLNPQLLSAITDAGYTDPTPIQEKAIPLINAGHDLIGIAQTGTGKTAAFVLPILMKLKYAQGNFPRAIIVAPSKELVIQIDENIRKYSVNTDLRTICCYGGIGVQAQIKQIEQGCDIIVATTGRLLDIYLRGGVTLKDLKVLVMDEADKMMDMGFMPQIRNILEVVPRKRQNLLFSATFPERMESLAAEFLDFPERVEMAPQATTVENVELLYYQVPNFKTKIHLLEHLLSNNESFNRVMIFTNKKKDADDVAKFIDRKLKGGVRVVHSNKGQNSRINAIKDFGEGVTRALVTTDVAARGIDINDVSHVINFDVPYRYEDYVHRVGRTARANKKGIAITFANKGEMLHLKKIENLIQKNLIRKEIPNEVEITKTPKEEHIEIERIIDGFKRKEDPDFKGAFHKKKWQIQIDESKKRKPKKY